MKMCMSVCMKRAHTILCMYVSVYLAHGGRKGPATAVSALLIVIRFVGQALRIN